MFLTASKVMNCMWLKIDLGVLVNGALWIIQHKELSIFFWAVRNPFSDFWKFKKYFWLLDPVLSELGKEREKEIYQFKLWTESSLLIPLCAKRNVRIQKLNRIFAPSLPSFFPSFFEQIKSQKCIHGLQMGRYHGHLSLVGNLGLEITH